MSMRIATCRWGESFEEFCAQAAAAGYEGIETNVEEGHEAEVRSVLQRHGLHVSASTAGGSFLDPATRQEEIERAVATARQAMAFGVDTMELHCGPRPVGGPSHEQLEVYAAAVNEIGRQCRPLGVRLGLHNHCILFLETEAEIDYLYRHLDPDLVGVGFDTGHLALAGADVAALYRRYADRTAYVHLKDLYQVSKPAGDSDRVMGFDEVLALAEDSDTYTWLAIRDIDGRRLVLGGGGLGHAFFEKHRDLIRGVRCRDIAEYQFAEIGQGVVDFHAVFASLRQAGFDGWAAVELDVTYRTRPESARISRDYIRGELGT